MAENDTQATTGKVCQVPRQFHHHGAAPIFHHFRLEKASLKKVQGFRQQTMHAPKEVWTHTYLPQLVAIFLGCFSRRFTTRFLISNFAIASTNYTRSGPSSSDSGGRMPFYELVTGKSY
jgi:hypothetical protein